MRALIASAALAALLTGCGEGGGSSSEDSDDTTFRNAYEFCKAESGKAPGVIRLADEDYTMLIDTKEENARQATWDALGCILVALDTPTAVTEAMQSTTAMMGMQEGDDGPLHYKWTYHPDNGLQVILTEDEG